VIVITGVTGKLGRIAAEDVLTRLPADQVAVVARDPAKARDLVERNVQVHHGDYDDPASLVSAFTGADVLLFVSSPDPTPGTRERQHEDVVNAAVKAGVGRVVYTSAITADRGESFLAAHQFTEQVLRESGLVFTLLRNTFYTEEFVNRGLLTATVAAGELTAPKLDHPLVTATRADLAQAAAAVVTGYGHDNAVYELRGPGWTFADLAAALSDALGAPVAFREVPDEEAGPMGFLLPLLRQPEFGQPTADLEQLLGRPATPLTDAVRAALAGR
jgi:NAD(P)H dehydrogenase (quinone)